MSKTKVKKESLIIQYTRILHKYGGPNSKQALAFIKSHKSNVQFVIRARTLNVVWQLI